MQLKSRHHRAFVWGHRGAPELMPENTLESFHAAINAGADGIELDVQLSSDNVAVVLHDDTLDRTTNGYGSVGQYTWKELSRLRIRNGAGELTTSKIPRLEEVFESIEDSYLCIEYKYGPNDFPGLVERTLGIVRHYQAIGRVMVSSFNQWALRQSAEIEPDVPRAVAWGFARFIEPWTVAAWSRSEYVHLQRTTIRQRDLELMTAHGLIPVVWGLRHADDVLALPLPLVAAIFVDNPAWAEGIRLPPSEGSDQKTSDL